MRKSVSKKLRFEVFKRDKFTCQYCGKKAPDVILEVDHIKPVSKGGDNSLFNLISSCFECNRGKGKRTLDNKTEVQRSVKSVEDLQEKRNQLNMMRQWIEEAKQIDDEIWDFIINYYFEKSPEVETKIPKGSFRTDLLKIAKSHNILNITDSIDYCLNVTNVFAPPQDRVGVGFWKRVYKRALYITTPVTDHRENTLKYCLGIYKNKFTYFQNGDTEFLKNIIMNSSLDDDEIIKFMKTMNKRLSRMDEYELNAFKEYLK